MSFTIEVSDEQVACWLCAAWEGGSNYWAEAEGTPYRENSEGKLELALPVVVIEQGTGKRFQLTSAKIAKGCALLHTLPHVAASLIKDDGDALDGDAFLQLCIFGELVYG